MAEPFRPGPGVKVACTTTSGSTRVNMGAQARQVRIVNTGSVPAFFAFGAGSTDATAAVPTTTAASGTVCVGAAAADVFTVNGAQYIAGITASSTADCYVSIGEGS